MKTPKVIKDDIYLAIKNSGLVAECEGAGGSLRRNGRPADARTQDVTINVLTDDIEDNDIQEAVVYVRIYFAGVNKDGNIEPDENVEGSLEQKAKECLSVINGGDFRATLKQMTLFKVEGQDFYAIACRLLYRQCE